MIAIYFLTTKYLPADLQIPVWIYDTILSSVYMQIKQAEQMGGSMMNGMVDEMDQMGGSTEVENPFEKALLNYLNEDLPRSFEQ